MAYVFKGNLCGYICEECREPLRRVKVRLYKLDAREDTISRAVANPKETFTILDDEAVSAKQSLLIAETETDADGNYSFELGENRAYDGGAFEVDVYVDSIDGNNQNRRLKPVQFSITVLNPLWRTGDDGRVWGWDYCLPRRWWCLVLQHLGIWAICGRVLLCEEDNRPVEGVKVIAYDRDWLQNDTLGSALTDSNGNFRIYYTTATFELGTFKNVELISGPDVYFRVETALGVSLLVEAPSRGRDPDRENIGHCFCVTLCLKRGVMPEEPAAESDPSFTHLGIYNYSDQVDSQPDGSGLTKNYGSAFYSSVMLNGILPKKYKGSPMEYRFEAREISSSGELGAWAKVRATQIGRTILGRLERANPKFPATSSKPTETIEYATSHDPNIPLNKQLVANIVSDTYGDWIQVPQESSDPLGPVGFFTPDKNLILLNTATLADFPIVDLTAPSALQAGKSVASTGKSLIGNKHFSIRMLVRKQGATTSGEEKDICEKVAINNTVYITNNHPTWMSQIYSRQGVAMVDVGQMIVKQGCSTITEKIDIFFTGASANLGNIEVTMTGPGGPYSFNLHDKPSDPEIPSGQERFGIADPLNFKVAKLASCAYIINLNVTILLTDGVTEVTSIGDQMAFCKS